ncbi:unnamed protein product [Arctia plantaginis]|uniref:HTH psq-type domain-containing protein n=1 Tax=Arctia plantaginis TaxID=874455 RepID=A0A8S1AVE0_ARCPL|nr:unnamed protein product [Arctia plantaginis]
MLRDQQIEKAIKAINKGMTLRLAALTYNIPRTTLIYRVKQGLSGPQTLLTTEEETELANWIQFCTGDGCYWSKKDMITNIGEYLRKKDKGNLFKDGVPGERWYHLFLKRHPELKKCMIIRKEYERKSNKNLL